MTELLLRSINIRGGTQSRERLNTETVNEYTELMGGGVVFPPVVVFYDGQDYWLADGFHRFAAIVILRTIEGSLDCEIRQGTQRDAILYSCGANAQHGLRRTNQDKRRAVGRLLADQEWSQLSNREIARLCNVTEGLVRICRESQPNEVRIIRTCPETSESATANQRLGADGKTYPAMRLNTTPPALPAPVVAYQTEEDENQITFALEEGSYSIRGLWDSIMLTPVQALELYHDLSRNYSKLSRLAAAA